MHDFKAPQVIKYEVKNLHCSIQEGCQIIGNCNQIKHTVIHLWKVINSQNFKKSDWQIFPFQLCWKNKWQKENISFCLDSTPEHEAPKHMCQEGTSSLQAFIEIKILLQCLFYSNQPAGSCVSISRCQTWLHPCSSVHQLRLKYVEKEKETSFVNILNLKTVFNLYYVIQPRYFVSCLASFKLTVIQTWE